MSTNKPFLMLQIYDHFTDLGDQKPREILIDKNQTFLGRGLDSDVVLTSETVSLKHSKIFFNEVEMCWMIEDLKSQNGIFFGEKKIETKKLSENDHFYLGEALVIAKLNSLNLEKTRSFSILVEKKKSNGAKDFIKVLALVLIMILINYKTSYFVTEMKFYESVGIFIMVASLSSLFGLAFSWISHRKFNVAKVLKFNFIFWCSLFFYDLLQDIFVSADFVWLKSILIYISIFSYFFLLPFFLNNKPNSKVLFIRSFVFTFFIFGMQNLNEMNKGKTHLEIPYVVSFSNNISLNESVTLLDQKIDKTFQLIQEDFKDEIAREK
jgi:hypothetical protein